MILPCFDWERVFGMTSVFSSRWRGWCWSWNSNTLATWCQELTRWKRPWCWERLKVRGEGDGRGWDGWMESLSQWTWVWVNSGSWWWTGRPGVLQSMGIQRVRNNWVTELNRTDTKGSYECLEQCLIHSEHYAFRYSSLFTIICSSLKRQKKTHVILVLAQGRIKHHFIISVTANLFTITYRILKICRTLQY